MSNEMKALAKTRPEVGLWQVTRPVPEIGPEDVLIKVKKTGICGTDIHIWNWDEWAARTVPVAAAMARPRTSRAASAVELVGSWRAVGRWAPSHRPHCARAWG